MRQAVNDRFLDRLASLQLLDLGDRKRWVAETQARLQHERQQIEERRRGAESIYEHVASAAALELVDVRLSCLERLVEQLGKETL
jgi:hypothetical protein